MHHRHGVKDATSLKAPQHWHFFAPENVWSLNSVNVFGGYIACAWLWGGLEGRIREIWDIRERGTDTGFVVWNKQLRWCDFGFPLTSLIFRATIKKNMLKYGCMFMTFNTFFLSSKTPREMGAQTAVEKFTICKSNFFTNHYQSLMIIKSLPVFNIHLLAFHLPRLSMLLKLISVSHRYVPSYSDSWYSLSHPLCWTAIAGHAYISFGPASRQIRHRNIQLCTDWRFKLHTHCKNHSRNLIWCMD